MKDERRRDVKAKDDRCARTMDDRSPSLRRASLGRFLRPPSLVPPPSSFRPSSAFTLVELLAAASIAAVGCVFVLGALSRCSTSLATAQKTVTADHLLASKMWDIDLAHRSSGGGEPGEWSGVCEPPHASFRWSQTTKNISADFGQATHAVSDALLEETVSVFWTQGRATRDVSVTRYIKRKKE